MSKAAIYARYSTDQQRPTSIDDQVRRCEEMAAKEGMNVENGFVFTDSALSGNSLRNRDGYQRLMDAWDDGMIQTVFADEVSRFARDMPTGSILMKKVEDTGIVVITKDGIDTRREGWQMLWSLKLVQASQETRGTASRVVRGMQGQLERGHMIAQAAFGYRLERVGSGDAQAVGTRWIIDPANAEVVRNMYALRHSGLSVAAIARHLNDAGIPSPRRNRKKQQGYWRPAAVYRVLRNTIYRGVFQWNGSAFSKAKAKRRRRTLDIVDYPRPDLRLVEDDLWYGCNPEPGTRPVRGGGKHVFAGLVECSECNAFLSVGGGPKHFSMHCAQCDQAVRVGAKSVFMGYTSLTAARQALLEALKLLFMGPVIQEFHARLKAKLHEKPADEEAQLQANLTDVLFTRERLMKLMRNVAVDDTMLEGELAKLSEEFKRIQGRLSQLEKRRSKVTQTVVEAQCNVDPLPLLKGLLDGQPQGYQVRATLRRLVRRFIFKARPARHHSVFEIEFVPGALIAELSETATVDEQPVRFIVEVKTSACRPVQWAVSVTRVI